MGKQMQQDRLHAAVDPDRQVALRGEVGL